jgi:phosphatidylserine decarboxylase
MSISREGWSTILIVLASATLLCVLGAFTRSLVVYVLFALNAIILALTIYFFRDPSRIPPSDPKVLVAPADGRVLEVREVDEPDFIGGKAMRAAIFLSVLDVHINYVPFGGTVKYFKYVPGKFLRAFLPEASHQNEHQLIGLETRYGKLLFKQSTGILARRIVCRLQMNEVVTTGQKFGVMKFGSRMEVYVPSWGAITCKEGERVRAGISVIGRVNENTKKN